jgi:hypothetical protein
MNVRSEGQYQRITLVIADLPVAILCNDARVSIQLREHYAAFLSDDQRDPLLVVNAFLDAAFPPPPYGQRAMHYVPHENRLVLIGAEALLNLGHGIVQLWLSPVHALENIDYTLRVVYAMLATYNGGLMLHAAGIVHQQSAYLFCGKSGSGKTTIARHSPPTAILNDDLVLLLPNGQDWYAYATPFWNPTQQPPAGQIKAPLSHLLFLVQDQEVQLVNVPPGRALAELLSVVPVITSNVVFGAQVMQIGSRLLEQVAAHYLHFRPDSSFWGIVGGNGKSGA